MIDTLRKIATHESGHCVAALSLGIVPLAFTLRPLGATLGSVTIPLRTITPGDCRESLTVLAAGGVAVSILTGELMQRGGPVENNDDVQSWRTAMVLLGLEAPPEALQKEIDAGEARARSILLANWATVERLATAMMETQNVMADLESSFPPLARVV